MCVYIYILYSICVYIYVTVQVYKYLQNSSIPIHPHLRSTGHIKRRGRVQHRAAARDGRIKGARGQQVDVFEDFQTPGGAWRTGKYGAFHGGTPIAGWFRMENTYENLDDKWGYAYLRKPPCVGPYKKPPCSCLLWGFKMV